MKPVRIRAFICTRKIIETGCFFFVDVSFSEDHQSIAKLETDRGCGITPSMIQANLRRLLPSPLM